MVVLAIRVRLEECGVCEASERVWFVCVCGRGADRGVFQCIVVTLKGKEPHYSEKWCIEVAEMEVYG